MKKVINLVFLLLFVCVFAQPSGGCTTGTTQLGANGRLYGCVDNSWRRLSESSPVNVPINGVNGTTSRVGNTVYVKENGGVYELKNVGFSPININGRFSQIGEIIYSDANRHFYEGVENGQWWQIDNPLLSGTVTYDYNYRFDTIPTYSTHFLDSTGPLSEVPDGAEVTLYDCYYSSWEDRNNIKKNTTFVENEKPFIKRTADDGMPYIKSKYSSLSTGLYSGIPIDITQCKWEYNK